MAWVLALSLVGCGDTNGTLPEGQPFDSIAGFSGSPIMNPGDDCLSCHSPSPLPDAGADAVQPLASGRPWTVAGTIYPTVDSLADGGLGLASIMVTDVTGRQLTLTSNAAGNFYTAEPLADLASIEVQNGGHRMVMQLSVVGSGALELVGSCNMCHQISATPGPTLGAFGAPGRLFIPPK
jgi:hypothetical protein